MEWNGTEWNILMHDIIALFYQCVCVGRGYNVKYLFYCVSWSEKLEK